MLSIKYKIKKQSLSSIFVIKFFSIFLSKQIVVKKKKKKLRIMPKVNIKKKKKPEGWDIIEDTLDQFQSKMREGNKRSLIFL